jgi:HTH-type transcriptional regulator / antitoxin HigA
MEIDPIKSDEDHGRAIRRIRELMGAPLNSPQGDELDVLATLVEAYEQRRYPMDPPDPIAAIEFCMDQQNLTRRDLESAIGPSGRVSEILNGKRSLTLPMIRRLHAQFGIPVRSLLGDLAQP